MTCLGRRIRLDIGFGTDIVTMRCLVRRTRQLRVYRSDQGRCAGSVVEALAPVAVGAVRCRNKENRENDKGRRPVCVDRDRVRVKETTWILQCSSHPSINTSSSYWSATSNNPDLH